MELISFLLDPNIAYLVLALTGVLLINAVLVPGTGILEVGALFALLLTAYQVYQLPFNGWALLVLIVGVLPFLAGIRLKPPMGMPYLALAIALFEVGSVFLYRGETWWMPVVNPLLALVVVILTSGYLWVVIRAGYQSLLQPPIQDIARLIGKIGEARSEIHVSGTVYVAGELWSARSDEPISPGMAVRVVERQGMVLKVVSAEA